MTMGPSIKRGVKGEIGRNAVITHIAAVVMGVTGEHEWNL